MGGRVQWEKFRIRRSSAWSNLARAGRAGRLHMKLRPGESIRTPSILLVQWDGKDRVVGARPRRLLSGLLRAQDSRPGGGAAGLRHDRLCSSVRGHRQKQARVPSGCPADLKDTDARRQVHRPTPALNGVNEKKNQLDYITRCRRASKRTGWMRGGSQADGRMAWETWTLTQ